MGKKDDVSDVWLRAFLREKARLPGSEERALPEGSAYPKGRG